TVTAAAEEGEQADAAAVAAPGPFPTGAAVTAAAEERDDTAVTTVAACAGGAVAAVPAPAEHRPQPGAATVATDRAVTAGTAVAGDLPLTGDVVSVAAVAEEQAAV